MKAVLIDDEHTALEELSYFLTKHNTEILGAFTSTDDGYRHILKEKPDIVFLDINMRTESGISLGLRIRSNLPDASIVFVTKNPRYSLEAYQVHPVDYILKPIHEPRLLHTLEYIRERLGSQETTAPVIPKITCFGDFAMFSGENNVRFATQKTKELLAFLLCNVNSHISRPDLIETIFHSGDEKKDANNLRVTLHRIRKKLMTENIKKEHLLIKENCSVVVAPGICDVVDFLNFISHNKMIHKANLREALRIIDLAGGELLCDIDALWVTEFREYVMVKLEELIINVALFHVLEDKKPLKAEYLLLKLIGLNPLTEHGHTALLDLCMGTSNTMKFVYYYRIYTKMLKEDHGCSPEKKYMNYYITYCS